MIHNEKHKLAGKTVILKQSVEHPQFNLKGAKYIIEDWADRMDGKSWKGEMGKPACLIYFLRLKDNKLPSDDEVLYGHVSPFGHLIHISEIEDYDILMKEETK